MATPSLHLTITVGLSLFASVSVSAAQSVDRTEVATMLSAVNAERARAGVMALNEDPRLDSIAEGHSLEMARSNALSHQSNTTGSPADRVTHAGLSWHAVAENIALNQSTALAQRALAQSPGHYQNMVDPAQRSIGIGIVRHNGQVWVTQLFATLTPDSLPSPAIALPTQSTQSTQSTQPTVQETTDTPDDNADPDDTEVAPEQDLATDEAEDVSPPSATATDSRRSPAQTAPSVRENLSTNPLQQLATALGLTVQDPPSIQNRTDFARTIVVDTPFGPMRVGLPEQQPRARDNPASRRPAPTVSPNTQTRTPPRPSRQQPQRHRVIVLDHLDV